MKYVRIIAHRCGPVSHSEQTVESAKEALGLGADMIELDVRLTRDGALAISHDENLLRVFGADARVGDLTKEEFLALRHKCGAEYRAHLFGDFIEAGIAPLLIHVKEEATIPPLVDEIIRHGYTDKVVIGVSTPDALTLVRSLEPSIKILAFASKELIPEMISRGVDYVRLWEGWLEPELVRFVKESPAELWVMSGNTDGYPVGEPGEDGLKKIISLSPDGILINDVRRLVNTTK